jgi:hypothetical protein
METLKPCKTCGAVPEIETHPVFGKEFCKYQVIVKCKCGSILTFGRGIKQTIDDAAKNWNERRTR